MNDDARRPEDTERPATPASLFETVAVLRRHLRTIVLCGAFGLLLAMGYVYLQGPKFRAAATILLERDSAGGVLGDLATLASLSSAPAAASEIMVLESRSLAEETVRTPAGDPLTESERHLGLTTLVHDKSLKPLALFLRDLRDEGPSDLPAVQPESRVFAAITEYTDDSPERIRVRFDSQVRLHLTTPGLAERLGLRDEYPVDAAYDPTQPILYRGVKFYLRAEGDCSGKIFVIERLAPFEAVERLMRSTTVAETALNSGVIEVAVEDSDPNRVAAITNALCNNYLESVHERGQKRASKMVGYIEELLNQQFTEFETAQEQIVQLQAEHPEMVAVEISAQAYIEQMAVVESERVKLDINQFALRQMAEALAEGDTTLLAGLGSEESGLFVDPITLGYLQQIATAQAELSSLEQEYTDEHYQVQNLRRTIADLHDRVRIQLEGRIDSLGSQEAELEKVRAGVESELAALPEGARELAMPLLQLEVYKELFPFLVRSLQSAEMTRAASVASADYIDRAAPATELDSPNVLRMAFIGIFLGLALGVLLAIVREPHAGVIDNSRELEIVGGAPVLSTIPRFRADRTGATLSLPLRDAPDGAAADAFRSLRYSLRAVLSRDDSIKCVGVTASNRGEGTSTTAIDLALAVSLDGRKVLLVDADLREPAVHGSLNVPQSPGLAESLATGASGWRDAVQAPELENGGSGTLRLLPAGTLNGTASSDLLSGPAVQQLLDEAKKDYDLVLVDLPPAGMGPDAEALAPLLDGVVVVYRSGTTSRARLGGTMERLRNTGTNLLGQVLNALPAARGTR